MPAIQGFLFPAVAEFLFVVHNKQNSGLQDLLVSSVGGSRISNDPGSRLLCDEASAFFSRVSFNRNHGYCAMKNK
jgi:hypothetical protein